MELAIVMRRTLSIWSVLLLMFCGVLAAAGDETGAPSVHSVRLGVDGTGKTRIVLDMDEMPAYVVTPVAGDTNRLRISIEQSRIALRQALPAQTGGVASVLAGADYVDVALTGVALPAATFVLEPTNGNSNYRLVIDIREVSPEVFAMAASNAFGAGEIVGEAAPEALAATTTPSSPEVIATEETAISALPPELVALTDMPPVPTLRPERPTQATQQVANDGPMIVIDPGHGGADPGALGSSGLREKNITLSAAVMLKDILEERGYNVLLTRTSDVYLDLPERIAFARDRNADVFLSLHADANPVPEARGATVYTLSSDRSEQMANEISTNGNFRVFDIDVTSADPDVGSILYDLANTDTTNHSSRLAGSIINEMDGRIRMVNNSHRQASLQVLLSPDVPAVLVELAFLSNVDDEANLGSVRWRRRAVGAVADGIDAYFDSPVLRQASRFSDGSGGAP